LDAATGAARETAPLNPHLEQLKLTIRDAWRALPLLFVITVACTWLDDCDHRQVDVSRCTAFRNCEAAQWELWKTNKSDNVVEMCGQAYDSCTRAYHDRLENESK
jgi:hypothetical protein